MRTFKQFFKVYCEEYGLNHPTTSEMNTLTALINYLDNEMLPVIVDLTAGAYDETARIASQEVADKMQADLDEYYLSVAEKDGQKTAHQSWGEDDPVAVWMKEAEARGDKKIHFGKPGILDEALDENAALKKENAHFMDECKGLKAEGEAQKKTIRDCHATITFMKDSYTAQRCDKQSQQITSLNRTLRQAASSAEVRTDTIFRLNEVNDTLMNRISALREALVSIGHGTFADRNSAMVASQTLDKDADIGAGVKRAP